MISYFPKCTHQLMLAEQSVNCSSKRLLHLPFRSSLTESQKHPKVFGDGLLNCQNLLTSSPLFSLVIFLPGIMLGPGEGLEGREETVSKFPVHSHRLTFR